VPSSWKKNRIAEQLGERWAHRLTTVSAPRTGKRLTPCPEAGFRLKRSAATMAAGTRTITPAATKGRQLKEEENSQASGPIPPQGTPPSWRE